jgi:hypothetical protein
MVTTASAKAGLVIAKDIERGKHYVSYALEEPTTV